MASRELFPPFYVEGSPPLVFNFSDQLISGETISTADVSVAVYTGTDAAAASRLSGAETISGASVVQALVGLVLGVIYTVTCEIVTSGSRTINKVGLVAAIGGAP